MVQEGRMLLNYVTMNDIVIRKILKKYDKSPWLIELGAFHLNCDASDAYEGFFKNGFFRKQMFLVTRVEHSHY
ncbi:putative E3 ubiquitin-protein ligase BAH1-like [Zea mays]|uniref:Putative E3 ubiquitin-protein ligase BAH1-like n=1 Tax=Zea mays TaxID=4577 RepID=A0A1D6GLC1_MAIZE|nr:putative E3 ubiquitin-protein ligase BAH1-like [Zea mays]